MKRNNAMKKAVIRGITAGLVILILAVVCGFIFEKMNTLDSKDSSGILRGEFSAEIKSARAARTPEDETLLIVTVAFGNNSKGNHAFSSVIKSTAFQNGVQLDPDFRNGTSSYKYEERDPVYDGKKQLRNVQPGYTYDVDVAFVLLDKSSPVTVECRRTWSFLNKDKVSKTFDIGKLV